MLSLSSILLLGIIIISKSTQAENRDIVFNQSFFEAPTYFKGEGPKINGAAQSTLSWHRLSLNLADLRLQEFFKKLEPFFRGPGFPFVAFVDSAEILKAELVEITIKIMNIPIYTIELCSKLHQIHHILNVMLSADPMLRLFDISGSIDEHLIHCISEFNVMLLGFYKLSGVPDCQRPGYAHKVYQYMDQLSFWRSEFLKLSHVRSDLSQVFDNQYFSARESLEELKKHIV